MDRITKSLLSEFVEENELESLEENTAFEHFCGHIAVSGHFSESFQTDDIALGSGGDCGIDCLAIIVNGCIVTSPEEIDDLEKTNGFIDATFAFVQAKRSSKFEAAQIGSFGFGVKDFFSEQPSLPQNEALTSLHGIMNEVFERSPKFKGNPKCHLYYMTTGQWNEDPNLVARREAVRSDLEELNLFSSVDFECVDASKLQELYRDSKSAVSTQVMFAKRTLLPELPGVEQSYLGVLSSEDFMRLLQNTSDEIISSLFYDNVRHWQDWNTVNTEMRGTLQDQHTQQYFPLLNNGVTIIAKKVSTTGDRFLIEDYQIVNGCQTSYVLYEMRDILAPDMHVPVRLIATEDIEIRNAIIKATNRQTQVSEDQFFAMSEFPRKLEAYFPTFEDKKALYYERRSKQYSSVDGIEKVRIVDMRTLVRAFASVFVELPHRTTRNYKALLKSITIFERDHKLIAYYTAAFLNYKLDFLFRNQTMPADLKPARYHLLLAFRLHVAEERVPPMNSRAMEKYCQKLLDILWDDQRAIDTLRQAETTIRTIANGNLHRDHIRTEPFTELLLQEFAE